MTSDHAALTVERLAARSRTATEADLQADLASLLLSGDLNLDLDQVVKREAQVGGGTRRRIDVEVGQTVFEVKKDLRAGNVLRDGEKQLAGYLAQREQDFGTRVAGILTDGTTWRLYRLDSSSEPVFVDGLDLSTTDPDADRLVSWLDSILATTDQIVPTPLRIAELLGAESPAHRFDHAVLRTLLDAASTNPEVQLKKRLWASLLRTAFGEAFVSDDRLFVNHSLLVITAEAIAHEIVGLGAHVTPEAMVAGTKFTNAQVFGVVEEDFFDWVIAVPGGAELVATVMRRVGRFQWSAVEHDVLKILYESVIEQRDRENLGEYYTPDWLAAAMVDQAIDQPATQRILDPSCGSGTFVFHAIRAHLAAVEAVGATPGSAAASATHHVMGLDIHPVAVTLARVTYLMALGTDRLQHPDRGALTIPVYLGDAVQWERHRDLLTDHQTVTVSTRAEAVLEGGGQALFGDDLVFPLSSWGDAEQFDTLVRDMGGKIISAGPLTKSTAMNAILKRHKIPEEDHQILRSTFDAWLGLHRSGRDHIWSYYVRNLVKPVWLSTLANRVDVLIGNPPWLRYSKMTAAMQARYKQLGKPRNLNLGALGASARDLSTLFVVRAVELYLKPGGRFAFVMPHGTLSRRPHAGFRSGRWGADGLSVTFATSWDTSAADTGFPMTSCVIFGTESGDAAVAMTENVQAWKTSRRAGHLILKKDDRTVAAIDADAPVAHYEPRFRQGAIIVPRMLLCVEPQPAGPLGIGAGRTSVESARSNLEKDPWKSLASLSGIVESEFVRPMHLGSTVLPFRTITPWQTVLPLDGSHILKESEIDDHPDLSEWWSRVEAIWATHRRSTEDKPLLERFDYHQQLSSQFPLDVGHRVVYTKAGNTLCSAVIADSRAVIDHQLYWGRFDTVEEARYLTGMLNAPTLLGRVQRYQTLGLFGARHFDKYVFRADFRGFRPDDSRHTDLVAIVQRCEQVAAAADISTAKTFQQARKVVVAALRTDGLLEELDAAATSILGPGSA